MSIPKEMKKLLDLVIKNGVIIDGTGKTRFNGDLGIKGNRVVEISSKISREANEVIDAEGLIVVPGFIDVHSHNDLVPLMKGGLGSVKLHQGVTTELVGQCGLGVVPCTDDDNGLWKAYVRGVVGTLEGKWGFNSYKDYLEKLSCGNLKNNYSGLVSHGAIRACVMGFRPDVPSKMEISKMCELAEEAMLSGAFGMSFGLQYMPAIFSKEEELIALCQVIEKHKGIVMVHLRNHDSTILKALDEIAKIAKVTNVKLHISHLRSYNSKIFGCDGEALIKFVEKATLEGVQITFDEHLYLSGSTLMTQLFPPYVTLEGLKNKDIKRKVARELIDASIKYPGWDNYSAVTTWDGVLITSVKHDKNQQYIGRTVGEIAKELGVTPVEFAMELLVQENGGVGIVTMNVFSEEDTIKLIQHPLSMIGSDSIPAGNPHPRLYGNFPLYLGKYIREKGALELEEAIRKVTQFPAKTIGYKDIGEINEDKIADIVIFNFNEIIGYEDYRNPSKAPIGIRYVILNGKIAVKDGIACEASYGEIKKKI